MLKNVSAPRVRELDHDECEAILARNCVGRIAFALYDMVDIKPLNYVYADGAIWARTSEGAMTGITDRNQRVAFEVDEAEGIFQWRSVVVHGTLETLSPEGHEQERSTRERAMRLLRRLVPDTLTNADPAAFRSRVFRITADQLTGREASMPYLD